LKPSTERFCESPVVSDETKDPSFLNKIISAVIGVDGLGPSTFAGTLLFFLFILFVLLVVVRHKNK